jgi:tellurium resistance protein TerD
VSSYVYLISNSSSVKIGKANNVEKRLASLQTGSSNRLKVVSKFELENSNKAHTFERYLHKKFERFKELNEWFNFDISEKELVDIVNVDYEAVISGILLPENDQNSFYKLKDINMVNLLIEFMPKGIQRDIIFTMLYSANKDNIVFDTTKDKKTYAQVVGKSEETINKVIQKLVNLNWIKQLNNYQYMVNPYYSIKSDIKDTEAVYLQHIWNNLNKNEEVEERINNKQDSNLKQLNNKIVKISKKDKEKKKLKETHLKQDMKIIKVEYDKYEKIFENFMINNGYTAKLDSKQMSHFSNYVRAGIRDEWSIFENVIPLHLDRTYLPLRELESMYLKKRGLVEERDTIHLNKGHRACLEEETTSIKNIGVGLGWDTKDAITGQDFDLDLSVFMLDKNKKLPASKYFVFYNNLQSPEGSVKHTGDNIEGGGDKDNETISVNLPEIPENIEELIFVVTIHEARGKKQNFGQVRGSFIRIYDEKTEKEIIKYELEEDFSTEVAVEFGRLYRKDGHWKFHAVGNGYNHELQDFVRKYIR